LSIFTTVICVVLWGIVTSLLSPSIARWMGQPALQPWLFWLPVPLMMMGLMQTFVGWLNFHKRYHAISGGRVVQATLASAINIAGGVWKSGSVGLLLGYMVGQIFAVLYFWQKTKLFWCDLRDANILKLARRYIDYPLYSAPAALLDVASSYAVIFIIGKFYSTEILGQFSLAHRLLLVPMVLVGGGVAQVFFQHVVECRKHGYSLPLFAILIIVAPTMFAFAFGETWRTAGEYARIVAFGYWIRLAVSPISTIFMAVGRLKTGTFWQVAYFISSYGVLGVAAWIHVSITQFLLLYMLEEITLYCLYFAMAYRVCDHAEMQKVEEKCAE
jgi:O-antigen/teichoic acid export membrane protein